MKVKAVIFDLDGTLLNTLDDLAASVNAALEKNNLPVRSVDEVRSFVGNGLRMLMQRAKVLFVLGMTDRGASGEDGLLTSAQKQALVERTKAYLGPDESDAARIRRLYLKSALAMAEEQARRENTSISAMFVNFVKSKNRILSEQRAPREIAPITKSLTGIVKLPEDFDEINELTELASSSTQYTYEELSALESDLKEQTNALKTYIQNRSMNRAKNSVFIIMDLLEERENKILEVENK